MKKTYLIVILTLLWNGVLSQTNVYHPFPDSNAVWVQNSDGWFGTSCWIYHDQNLFINGDTILSGYSYHKLYVNEYVSEFCSPPGTPFPPYYSFGGYYGAFRQDISTKRVYLYKEGLAVPDVLAYDYNLQIGDSIPISCLNTSSDIFVYNIDSVLVGSQYNKRFWLTNGLSYNFPVLLEGLGSSWGAFASFQNPLAEWSEYLWCVKINNQTVWKYDTSYECSIITKVDNLENQIFLKIYPNPFSQYTTIRTNTELQQATLIIENSLGQEVRRQDNISGREINVQRENFVCGFYFIILIQENKIIGKFKAVITN